MFRPRTRAIFLSHRSFCISNSTTTIPPSLCHPKPHNILQQINTLSLNGHLQQALDVFYTLQVSSNSPLSLQIYATLFHACARQNYVQQGMDLHHYMINNTPIIATDLFVTNHLINMYCKFGYLDYAHNLFDQMPRRNVVSWTALISGYAQCGQFRECFGQFSAMLVHYIPNEFAFASLISACDEYDKKCGQQVHALAIKISVDSSIFVANALITMYSKCCGCDNNYDHRKDDAWTVFKSMESRNLISWNSMISGFELRGLRSQAMNIFTQMHHVGVGFDRATLLSVFSSFCDSRSKDGNFIDVYLSCCLQLHCLSIKTGFISELEVTTALVKSYSDLGGEVSDCLSLFSEASSHKDIVLQTAVMTACAERNPETSLFFFCQLQKGDFMPDLHTFSIALKACATFASERHASAIHSQVIKWGIEDDIILGNALIHAYARCGSMSLSKQVFDEMGTHDLVSWNSMLKSFALHGKAKEALQLFECMNVHPDSATCVSLLSACSHAGLVEEGIKIFDSMSKDHGIAPQLDHYACMVDIYGRAGRLFEAKEFISKMPMKPDSVVWSALLGSCRKHGEMHLAEIAADKLKELDPGNSLGYVQMSNIYCNEGSFVKAGLIRKEMRGSKVRKEPGLSWIEIDNHVHEFASGGKHHPEWEVICTKVESLIVQLKGMGYVPETSLALHDIEEESKEEKLFHHSEKMALVYAVMNGNLHHGGKIIKIIKNIRICVDCHNFMELASKLFKKEIIVRDSNRFHHFKDGICSCKDYW